MAVGDPSDLNKGQKLVQMLELASRPGGVRASELMRRFDLDPRSLRRYLADLRDIDVPLHDAGRGDQRVIQVDGRYQRQRVSLTLSEVLSLHFGRTLFSFLDGTSFAQDLDDALERLAPMIARTHDDMRGQLDTLFVAVPEPRKDYRGASASDIIDEVITAVVYAQPLDARYRRAALHLKRYTLHPYTLAVYRQGLYLLAYDVADGAVKTFAVDRFEEVARNHRERFERPPAWDPRAHLAAAFGIVGGTPETVRIRFEPGLRAYAEERVWHDTQRLVPEPDGGIVLEMHVAVTAELERWVRGFGAQIEVLAPASLRERVLSDARAVLERAGSAR